MRYRIDRVAYVYRRAVPQDKCLRKPRDGSTQELDGWLYKLAVGSSTDLARQQVVPALAACMPTKRVFTSPGEWGAAVLEVKKTSSGRGRSGWRNGARQCERDWRY